MRRHVSKYVNAFQLSVKEVGFFPFIFVLVFSFLSNINEIFYPVFCLVGHCEEDLSPGKVQLGMLQPVQNGLRQQI